MVVLYSLLVAVSLSQTPSAADPVGRISGRVTLEGANTPIAGARIMLMPAGRPAGPIGPPPQTLTDQEGRFAFDQLTPGTYRIDAQKTGYAPLLDPSRAPTVQVGAGQAIDGVDLRLQKGAVIAGRLLDPAGDPLPDARVMALRRVSPPGAPPRLIPAPGAQGQPTNDLGEFRVSGLPPGEYFVAATPRSMPMLPPFGAAASGGAASTPRVARTTIATTFYPGTTDQAGAQPLAVTAGAEVNGIVFSMQSTPAFRVSGIVVDENGDPVAGAMVMLMADPRSGMFMGPAGNARARDNGGFDIDDVPPGSYRLNGSVPMSFGSSTAGGTGAVAGVTGGFAGPTFRGGPMVAPAEVVVTDADVNGVRVTVRRPPTR
jgi:protocatechuate 3,4-dioxygenase beta subunit